jgi:type III restriction enzyme
MPRPRKVPAGQLDLLEARVRTAPCVPALRIAVADGRDKGYPGTTETTRTLLNYWFKTDHRLPNGRMFRYHDSQRQAVETLIYVYEVAQTSQEVISFYAKRIAQDVKLPSQFAALVPKVREFLETIAFGQRVSLDSPAMIAAISSNVVQFVTVDRFAKALRTLVVEDLTPTLLEDGRRLSETQPFPYSRPTCNATKTVFNLVPCDNEFERRFARFLEDARDVERFAKLPSQFGFTIEYTDAANNLRYYEPDFVAVLDSGMHYLVETKGREDIDVAHKDRAARIWCENATMLTGTYWDYLKVPQTAFNRLQPTEFSDALVLAST